MKRSIAGLSADELDALFRAAPSVARLGKLPSFRLRQIAEWVWRGADSFAAMTNLPKELRADLDSQFRVYSSTVSAELHDDDGTRKIQITLYDGEKIEAVLLADAVIAASAVDGEDASAGATIRYTACLSTQIGCPAACVFCKTGSLGFRRNLTAAEIVEQFLHLNRLAFGAGSVVSNIVVMGMGEPLFNLRELRKALNGIIEGAGQGNGSASAFFSRTLITLKDDVQLSGGGACGSNIEQF